MTNSTNKPNHSELFSLLTGRDNWSTAGVCGLPSVRMSDGPHGLRYVIGEAGEEQIAEKSVCYPTLSALGNSFDEDLVYRVGQAIAEDCIRHDVALILGPGVNLKRTPLCGRNFEYFSEDGVLSGKLAAAYIGGVQSKGIGTSLKHFAANNREYDRFFQSSELDERTLRETYCRAFEIALGAHPWTVMCSYNPVNGVYASENRHLLRDILRQEFGFDGVVVSDWGAVRNRAKSLLAGVDLAMPYDEKFEKQLDDWSRRGLISDADVQESADRIRALVQRYKAAEPLRVTTLSEEQKHDLAVSAAEQCAVLLKNEGILPLQKQQKIALIGGFATDPEFQGGGSSRVTCDKPRSLTDCLAQEGLDVRFALGYMIRYHMPTPFGLRYAVDLAAESDCAVICVGNTWLTEKEETDRFSIRLNPIMEDLISRVADVNPNVVVVLYTGSAVDISAFRDRVKAILYMGFGGEGVNEAAAKLLSGAVSPCGKLAETFPACLSDTATGEERGNGYAERYAEGCLVGYKYAEYHGIVPAYPFGHGLSYTQFAYEDLRVEKMSETDYRVTFAVRNTGTRDAAEIVQVYVADQASMVIRPKKELVGFAKKHIAAGARQEFSFSLSARDFAYFSPVSNRFYVENGTFTVMVGAGSADIRLTHKICIRLPDEEQFSQY